MWNNRGSEPQSSNYWTDRSNEPIKNVWSLSSRDEGKGVIKIGSGQKLEEKKKKLEKDMAEMFGNSFDIQMIRDVIISHDYDDEKSLESFLQMADDSSGKVFKLQENPFEKMAESLIMSVNQNKKAVSAGKVICKKNNMSIKKNNKENNSTVCIGSTNKLENNNTDKNNKVGKDNGNNSGTEIKVDMKKGKTRSEKADKNNKVGKDNGNNSGTEVKVDMKKGKTRSEKANKNKKININIGNDNNNNGNNNDNINNGNNNDTTKINTINNTNNKNITKATLFNPEAVAFIPMGLTKDKGSYEIISEKNTAKDLSKSNKQFRQRTTSNFCTNKYAAPQKTVLSVQEAQERILNYVRRGAKVLVLLRGCPGSGKSTMAEQIKYNGVVLSTDSFFASNGGGGSGNGGSGNDNSGGGSGNSGGGSGGSGLFNFDPSRLSEAHDWNKTRASNNMRRGDSPVIIDNTNTQVWEMLPYVQMAEQHGYAVEVVESSVAWRLKPGKLAKNNIHSVSMDKIKGMLDRYEHNVTAEMLVNMVRSKGPASNTFKLTNHPTQNSIHPPNPFFNPLNNYFNNIKYPTPTHTLNPNINFPPNVLINPKFYPNNPNLIHPSNSYPMNSPRFLHNSFNTNNIRSNCGRGRKARTFVGDLNKSGKCKDGVKTRVGGLSNNVAYRTAWENMKHGTREKTESSVNYYEDDKKVTSIDDNNEKVTSIDDNNEKVTSIDDNNDNDWLDECETVGEWMDWKGEENDEYGSTDNGDDDSDDNAYDDDAGGNGGEKKENDIDVGDYKNVEGTEGYGEDDEEDDEKLNEIHKEEVEKGNNEKREQVKEEEDDEDNSDDDSDDFEILKSREVYGDIDDSEDNEDYPGKYHGDGVKFHCDIDDDDDDNDVDENDDDKVDDNVDKYDETKRENDERDDNKVRGDLHEVNIMGGHRDNNEISQTFSGSTSSTACVGTEACDWLVVDQLVRGLKTSFGDFTVIKPKVLESGVNEDETNKEKAIANIKPENNIQIVKNNVKQLNLHFKDLDISRGETSSCLKFDASAQTEDEEDVVACDEKLALLSNCFPQVDLRHLKYLYESCNRSSNALADILVDFGYHYNEEKPFQGDSGRDEFDGIDNTKEEENKDNIAGRKEINSAERKVTNKSHNSPRHKHLYVINSASKKPILDSINRKVFNPNTKYRHSKKLSDLKPRDERCKDSKQLKEVKININSNLAYQLWRLCAPEADEWPIIETDLTLSVDEDTCNSLFNSLKQALADDGHATTNKEIAPVDQSSLLATRIKFKELVSTFPNVNKQILANIFQASGYSQKVSVSTIVESGLDQPAKESMTQQFVNDLELQLIQKASLEEHERSHGEASERGYEEGEVTRDINQLYNSLLDQVTTSRTMLTNKREQAKEAIRSKQFSVAGFYTQEAKFWKQKMNENRHLAAEILFQKKFNVGQGMVDLHGFTCDQVLAHLPTIIQQQLQYFQNSRRGKGHLFIVTGSGMNSPGGVPKIKPLVENYLRKNNYSFRQITQGILKLSLNH